MRRALRILGTLLVATGAGFLAWAGVTWAWQDPFTTVYTRLEQRGLASDYEARARQFDLARQLDLRAFEATAAVAKAAPERRPQQQKRPERQGEASASAAAAPARLTPAQRSELAEVAARYRKGLREGDGFGRMAIPRLGIDMVAVEGTEPGTLRKGPGRYRGSRLPGEGELIYVAGHRTTYSAPFARIDALRPGDRVVVELPYATFEYRIVRHVIVRADELSVLRSRGREELALQACHPRFFASHRYIAYAVPVEVTVAGVAYRF